jgi:hypothetical protein
VCLLDFLSAITSEVEAAQSPLLGQDVEICAARVEEHANFSEASVTLL